MTRTVKALVLVPLNDIECSPGEHRHIMSNLPKDLNKCEITACLNFPRLIAILKLKVLDLSLVKGSLARPFQSLSPALVSEP